MIEIPISIMILLTDNANTVQYHTRKWPDALTTTIGISELISAVKLVPYW